MLNKLLCFKSAILIVSILTFSACGIGGDSNNIKNDVLESLSDENAELLESLFCEKMSEYSSLNNEIEAAMEFFEGKIVSVGNTTYPSESSVRDGKEVIYRVNPYIQSITTDAGKTYNIKYHSYLICNDCPEKIGISEILIIDENGNKCKIGDYYFVNS